MKYLEDYIKEAQTKLFEELGIIFAFSTEQFKEQYKEELVPYCPLGAGTYCPKKNVDAFLERHDKIVKEGIALDLKENGKEDVILRELLNHECFYLNSIEDCVDKLGEYPDITVEDIKKVYREKRQLV